ncbi:hypothetical protein [Streptomyces europaeiscabiei]|uniref:hypothetical protein n=1 Tax=Streptomyces europaeiscabiei TaxID=146819 RepID=UPI002E178B8B
MIDAAGVTTLIGDDQSRRLWPELVADRPGLTVLMPERTAGAASAVRASGTEISGCDNPEPDVAADEFGGYPPLS